MAQCFGSPLPLVHLFIDANIIHIRRIPRLWFEHMGAVILEEQADGALLVFQIAEDARAHRANLDTCWLQPFGYAVITPCALVGRHFLVVEEACAIWTSLDAVLAANANLVVDENHAVFGPVGCADRTDLDTVRGRAMVA